MKTFKTIVGVTLVSLTVAMGIFNVAYGMFQNNNWQAIAGIWQLIAGANWAYDLIPNDLVGKKEDVK